MSPTIYGLVIHQIFVYRITRFFTGSYFRVLVPVFILVGEVIFVEEKFAYRWSIKNLTAPGEDLFGVRVTAENKHTFYKYVKSR